MSSKESISEISLKELGSLQKKVLFFLAENPDNHKQAIQQGINYPAEQYGSVAKAVTALENSDYIESKEVFSKKGVKIKSYICTELGVFYTLCKNPYANFIKVLDSYKNQSETWASFRGLYDVWGNDGFVRFFRDVSDFLPMMKKEGIEKALTFLFLKIAMDAQALDPKTRRKNAKAAMKQFPHTKQMMKEWTKNINELL